MSRAVNGYRALGLPAIRPRRKKLILRERSAALMCGIYNGQREMICVYPFTVPDNIRPSFSNSVCVASACPCAHSLPACHCVRGGKYIETAVRHFPHAPYL